MEKINLKALILTAGGLTGKYEPIYFVNLPVPEKEQNLLENH